MVALIPVGPTVNSGYTLLAFNCCASVRPVPNIATKAQSTVPPRIAKRATPHREAALEGMGCVTIDGFSLLIGLGAGEHIVQT